MSRIQFTALNVVGGVCCLLILGDVVLALLNGRLNQSVAVAQNQFNQAQQVKTTTENLVVRIARAGQTEAALRELLAKHEFKVSLNANRLATPPP